MTKSIRIFCLTGLGTLLICLVSCEQKQEPMTPPPQQVVVVKKSIDHSKRAEKSKAANLLPPVPQVEPNASAGGPESSTKKDEIFNPDVGKLSNENQTGDMEEKEITPDRKETASGESAFGDKESVPAKSGSITEIADEDTVATLVIEKYDNKGRIDPFIPLLSEKKEEEASVEPVEEKPKRILTPLEKMELGQIRLVAVIEMKDRTVAMVEEASGKGYEVQVGTYIGRNGGQVTAITADTILVTEYVKDFKGNRKERLQEIKFHKDEGGE